MQRWRKHASQLRPVSHPSLRIATPTLGLDLPRHDVKVKTLEEAKGPEMLEWIEQAGHSAGLEMRGAKMQFLGEVDAIG